MADPQIPNPGSPEAYDQGCTCPWLDNNKGVRPPFPASSPGQDDGWYVSGECPLHAFTLG